MGPDGTQMVSFVFFKCVGDLDDCFFCLSFQPDRSLPYFHAFKTLILWGHYDLMISYILKSHFLLTLVHDPFWSFRHVSIINWAWVFLLIHTVDLDDLCCDHHYVDDDDAFVYINSNGMICYKCFIYLTMCSLLSSLINIQIYKYEKLHMCDISKKACEGIYMISSCWSWLPKIGVVTSFYQPNMM